MYPASAIYPCFAMQPYVYACADECLRKVPQQMRGNYAVYQWIVQRCDPRFASLMPLTSGGEGRGGEEITHDNAALETAGNVMEQQYINSKSYLNRKRLD
ncbi:hypothetical protein J3458_003382 [Metarhizium acridum]|uniref:uncharacterized protein n=1 Tax=Metarhizium acridum TaxID=92637 RepID=UPI001C6B5167|nr:hypothetical protein J3458_003382 [Metarhizium acridum]